MHMTSLRCPACSAGYPDEARFCPRCGKTVPKRPSVESDDGAGTGVQSKRDQELQKAPTAARATKRIIAGAIDIAIAILIMEALRRSPVATVLRWRSFILFCLPAAYLVFKDTILGKSAGKMVVGLTTWNVNDARAAGFSESVLRNWMFFCLILPPYVRLFRLTLSFGMILCAVVSCILGLQIALGKGRRFGDGAAGTIVVEDIQLRSRA
ncbi:MAG: zinc ribbon domain-containing protein [bacterium]|nr:zinc ribbon domain-containing protein [bacterium]